MKLSWKERNRTRILERLDDIAALPPRAVAPSEGDVSWGAEAAGMMANSDAKAFIDAGWTFVPAAAPAAVRAADQNRRAVYQDSGGRLVIDGRRLTVRFRPEATESRVLQALSRHGLKMEGRLTFAPNLFEVSPAERPDSDIVELANEIGSEPDVVYASPSFVEAISGRSG